MISLQKQFLFIHVPKTGGNSIQNILSDHSEDKIVSLAGHHDGIERFEVRSCTHKVTKHSTLSHYKSTLGSKTYRSLFKFATIRNPWDMMISFYFSPHRGESEWNKDAFLELLESVPKLRHYICERNFLRIARSPWGTGMPQLDCDVDYIIKFERLDEDFQRVCEKLSIPYRPLPIRNRSARKHYSAYYDDETKQAVGRKFAEEIEYGNYRFEAA